MKAKFGWIPAPYAASLLAVLEKRSNFKKSSAARGSGPVGRVVNKYKGVKSVKIIRGEEMFF